MNCPICKVGYTASGHTVLTLERQQQIVLFKNVPAQICNNCGSFFLDADTTRLLLQKAEVSLKNGAALEVLHLQAA